MREEINVSLGAVQGRVVIVPFLAPGQTGVFFFLNLCIIKIDCLELSFVIVGRPNGEVFVQPSNDCKMGVVWGVNRFSDEVSVCSPAAED